MGRAVSCAEFDTLDGVRIAALQWDVRRADAAWNLERVSEGLSRAKSLDVDLVLLPEMWATSFPSADEALDGLLDAADRAAARLAEASREWGIDLAGSRLARGGGSRPLNRFELYVGGERRLAYDKLHLFGPTAEDQVFAAGERLPPTVEWRGARLSALVCYDLRFLECWRAPFLADADLILVSAQWPSPRASQWRALVHGLAASCQAFVLACNRVGVDRIGRRELELEFPGNSLAVDPTGATLAEGRGESGLLIADVDLTVAAEWRRRIPVRSDRRPELEAWRNADGGGPL